MSFGLSAKHLEELVRFIRLRPEIEQALIFGSRATGTFKADSDIDIAIKGKHVDIKCAAALKYDYDEESYLPYFVDVVDFNSAAESLRSEIDLKGRIIYPQEDHKP